MDREIEGLKRTVKVLNDNDIEVVGTRREEGPGYIIKNLNGMKIGFVNYTYETSVIDGMRSLNGIPIPEDDKHLIDSFNIEDRALMEADMKDMSERIKAMREDGAEFIVLHSLGHGIPDRPGPDSNRDVRVPDARGRRPHHRRPVPCHPKKCATCTSLTAAARPAITARQLRVESAVRHRGQWRFAEDGIVASSAPKKPTVSPTSKTRATAHLLFQTASAGRLHLRDHPAAARGHGRSGSLSSSKAARSS